MYLNSEEVGEYLAYSPDLRIEKREMNLRS